MRHGSIAVSSFILAALACSAPSRADLVVEPPTPSTGMSVAVTVLTDDDGMCLRWAMGPRNGFDITLVGSPPSPLTVCPIPGQILDLGLLPVGRYHIQARRLDGTVKSEVYFTVTPTPAFLFTDEAVVRPARPTTADPVDIVLSLDESPPCVGLLRVHDVAVAGDTITITMEVSTFPFLCPPSPARKHGFAVHLPPLTAGLKNLTVAYGGVSGVLHRAFTVEDAGSSVLLASRFEATLSWTDPTGTAHEARPERLSENSAVYSFSDRANVELTVKALDGQPVNGKFWIFAASLTDQPWQLRVVDRASTGCATGHCAERTYEGIAHQNANVLDTQAFAP